MAACRWRRKREFVDRAFVLTEVFRDLLDEAQTDAITIRGCMAHDHADFGHDGLHAVVAVERRGLPGPLRVGLRLHSGGHVAAADRGRAVFLLQSVAAAPGDRHGLALYGAAEDGRPAGRARCGWSPTTSRISARCPRWR